MAKDKEKPPSPAEQRSEERKKSIENRTKIVVEKMKNKDNPKKKGK